MDCISLQFYFTLNNMEVKKMITSYIIKRVNVFKDYKLNIELNLDIQQFLNGIDNITEEKANTVAS